MQGAKVPFFAAGISSVMHPRNPHCPTMHFNYRCVTPAGWVAVARSIRPACLPCSLAATLGPLSKNAHPDKRNLLHSCSCRYFQTEAFGDTPGQWWFGGGMDITPCYVVPEDMRHFHGTLKAVCDRHDPEFYARFKPWCDDYFTIKHRGEMRGLGGIFFDDLNDRPRTQLLDFAKDALAAVPEAYVPIVKKHVNDPYDERQKQWQQLRRGR